MGRGMPSASLPEKGYTSTSMGCRKQRCRSTHSIRTPRTWRHARKGSSSVAYNDLPAASWRASRMLKITHTSLVAAMRSLLLEYDTTNSKELQEVGCKVHVLSLDWEDVRVRQRVAHLVSACQTSGVLQVPSPAALLGLTHVPISPTMQRHPALCRNMCLFNSVTRASGSQYMRH